MNRSGILDVDESVRSGTMEVVFKSFDSVKDRVEVKGRAWVDNGVARWEPASLMLDQQRVRFDDHFVHPDDGDEFLRGLVSTFRSAPYWWASFADREGSGDGGAEAV